MALSRFLNGERKTDKEIKNKVKKASDEENISEKISKYESAQRHFQLTSMGIIMTALGQKGIACQMGNLDDLSEEKPRS